MAQVDTVKLAAIEQPANIRRDVGDITELAASIKEVGLLTPLTVRALEAGAYQLIAGYRRAAALKKLRITEVPVRIVDSPTEDPEVSRLAMQLVENLQRVDLAPIEEASAFAQLKAYGLKQKDIAKMVGRSEAVVSKRLSLLELPDRALDLADKGKVGSESLYQLTQVVAAGGDLTPIIEQLEEADLAAENPRRAEEVEIMTRRAVQVAKAREDFAARAVELQAAGVNVTEPATDQWGSPKLPKNPIGWSGVDLDETRHLKEPCALVALYIRHGSLYESQHCVQPSRHAPDGESKLKTKTEAKPKNPYAKEEAAARARGKALTEASTAVLETKLTVRARERILTRVAELYVDQIYAEVHTRAAKWLGLTAELEGEYKGLAKLYAEAATEDQTRILLALVLAHGYSRAGGANAHHNGGAELDSVIGFLAEFGQEVKL